MQNNRNLIFPFSYNVCRKDSLDQKQYDSAIFQGFGLTHKESTTKIYISSLNYTGKSAVCQPIGEAIGLVKDIILAASSESPIATYKLTLPIPKCRGNVNEMWDKLDALFDWGDCDFFPPEKCLQLRVWLKNRLKHEVNPTIKPVYDVLLDFTEKAIKNNTGISFDF